MFLDTDTAAPAKFLVIDHFDQFNFSLAYPHLQQRIRGARVRMRGEARRINNPNTANMPTTCDDIMMIMTKIVMIMSMTMSMTMMMMMMICSSPSDEKDQDANDSDNEDRGKARRIDQQSGHRKYAHNLR